MQLYDLRREAMMREARNWFISFFPESVDDVMRTLIDPTTSGYYRMVTTYWDMAASFVLRGAIDEAMFLDSAGEAWVVFAKIQPYLEEVSRSPGKLRIAWSSETPSGRPIEPEIQAALERTAALLKGLVRVGARGSGHRTTSSRTTPTRRSPRCTRCWWSCAACSRRSRLSSPISCTGSSLAARCTWRRTLVRMR